MPNLPTIDKIVDDDRFKTFVVMSALASRATFAEIIVQRSTKKVLGARSIDGWVLHTNGSINKEGYCWDQDHILNFVEEYIYRLAYDYATNRLGSLGINMISLELDL